MLQFSLVSESEQRAGGLSKCWSDQLVDHAQSLSPLKTDVGDLCHESQWSFWAESRRASQKCCPQAHIDHNCVDEPVSSLHVPAARGVVHATPCLRVEGHMCCTLDFALYTGR